MPGWYLTVGVACLYEAWALLRGHQTLSEGMWNFRKRRPYGWLGPAAWAALTYHLFREGPKGAK